MEFDRQNAANVVDLCSVLLASIITLRNPVFTDRNQRRQVCRANGARRIHIKNGSAASTGRIGRNAWVRMKIKVATVRTLERQLKIDMI